MGIPEPTGWAPEEVCELGVDLDGGLFGYLVEMRDYSIWG
jgi:hypothetical protein